jgi:uncharacterized protein (DUF58 family)
MSGVFLAFILFLFLLAVIVKEDFVFLVLYLLAGAYIFGGWWSRKAIRSISFNRSFQDRVFINEEIPVRLEVKNSGWLPMLWLRIHDSLPVDLALTSSFRYVLSLGPHDKKQFEYKLLARKRGFYRVGPLSAFSGDVLGLTGELRKTGEPEYLTVYPRIVPLTSFKLPSRSPMGTLRHTQPIFEDPARVLSKRDYVAGDSLRLVDWKASANTGRLKVKQFEPTIDLQTSIFLNFKADEYELHTRFDMSELAVVVAASIASWIAQHKGSVGLATNGLDPFLSLKNETQRGEIDLPMAKPVPSRKGQSHLMRILDILARVRAGETIPFTDLLQKETIHLSWGTTLILITPRASDSFFDELFAIRRAGLDVVILLVGQMPGYQRIKQRAESFKFPIYRITHERDMDIWRH